MTSCGTETETVSRTWKAGLFDYRYNHQPVHGVTGVAVSLLVPGLTVDVLSTFCGVFMVQCRVKLMLRISEFGFYCLTVLFVAEM